MGQRSTQTSHQRVNASEIKPSFPYLVWPWPSTQPCLWIQSYLGPSLARPHSSLSNTLSFVTCTGPVRKPLHLCTCCSLLQGGKKRGFPSLSFQRIPACFRKYLQGSLLQEALSHLTFQVCLCGILQTEFCKDTWSILTPLEAGNLRPSQQLAAFSRAQYWLGLGVSMVSYIALIPVSAWDHFMGDGLALVLLVSPPL